jgi:hypothetical protein
MSMARRFKEMNRPPEGEPWCWFTHEMLISPAWRAMSHPARTVVERVLIEHMQRGGVHNGALIVTYMDFVRHGVRKNSIHEALLASIALGFLDRTEIGHMPTSDIRRPSKYGLTWLPQVNGVAASNRWRRIRTPEEAEAALKQVKAQLQVSRLKRRRKPPRRGCGRDAELIEERKQSEPMKNRSSVTLSLPPSNENATCQVSNPLLGSAVSGQNPSSESDTPSNISISGPGGRGPAGGRTSRNCSIRGLATAAPSSRADEDEDFNNERTVRTAR